VEEVLVDEVVVPMLDVVDDDVLDVVDDDVLDDALDEVVVDEVDDVVDEVDDVVVGPVPSVVVVRVVDVVEDIWIIGQACPAGRGVQIRVSVFLSTRFGCSSVRAITVIVRFLACRRRRLSLRMLSVTGPQVELVRGGTLTADAGLTVTRRSNPGRQPSLP
jgi:hypothetical protein